MSIASTLYDTLVFRGTNVRLNLFLTYSFNNSHVLDYIAIKETDISYRFIEECSLDNSKKSYPCKTLTVWKILLEHLHLYRYTNNICDERIMLHKIYIYVGICKFALSSP